MFETAIPSPPQGIWYVWIFPIKAYSIAILVGILISLWWVGKRYQNRGGNPENLYDMAIWAVPFGIIGGRIYHVCTSWQPYFGPNGNPWDAFKIWHGGLGIWGGIGLGTVVAFIWLRKHKLEISPMADAAAPALLLGQAIGRLGNYFNQELFGAPTSLPWGLKIDLAHRPLGYEQFTTFHPTFLYELLWNLVIAAILVSLDRRIKFKGGQLFALYICGYTLGRVWIEALRIDDANHIFGLRLNIWTSILVFVFGLLFFLYCNKREFVSSVSNNPSENSKNDRMLSEKQEESGVSDTESTEKLLVRKKNIC